MFNLKKTAPIILLSLIIFIALASPASALDVKRKTLPNGLTVLHVERHNLPLVMATLLVRAGQFDEPKDGLANLTASLLAEGTKTRSSTQISEETEFIGANLGASADADFTTLTISVLKKDVDKGFELLADILLNPAFPEEEIKREKDLIKGSLRQSEEDPSYVARKAFNAAVFGDHPYGRPIRGSAESIDGIGREDIKGFYSDYFVPGNSILTVVGDLDKDELDKLIAKHLSGWIKKATPARRQYGAPPPSARVIKIDKDLTQATVVLGHIGVRRDNPDYYALTVMNYILGGGGFSSRLMSKIRDEKGLAYDVYSVFAPHRDSGLFQAGVQTKNSTADEAVSDILDEMKRIAGDGVTETELRDAKSYLTGSFPRRLDTMRRITDFLSSVEFYGLGLDYIDKYPSLIDSVTADDVKRVARTYLQPGKTIIVVVGKQSEAGIKDDYR